MELRAFAKTLEGVDEESAGGVAEALDWTTAAGTTMTVASADAAADWHRSLQKFQRNYDNLCHCMNISQRNPLLLRLWSSRYEVDERRTCISTCCHKNQTTSSIQPPHHFLVPV